MIFAVNFCGFLFYLDERNATDCHASVIMITGGSVGQLKMFAKVVA